MKLGKIWKDGELVDAETATETLAMYTLHYGIGAFEGIRAYKRADGTPTVFRLRDHIRRLFQSARLVLLEPRVSPEQVEQGCIETLRANGLDQGYLRPVIYVGSGKMGIYAPDNPIHTAVLAWKWGAYLGEEGITHGIRGKISSFARHHVNVSLAKGKLCGQYINSILAKREAKFAGYDEAIMLDPQGYVCEGTGENIFIVRDGVLITPDLSNSILAGITRDTILTLAREEGIVVHEGRITRDELWLADEAFLTGTAAEVTPLREVDNRPIGKGTVGPITKRLQDRYFGIVRGSDASHPEWLTAY